MEETYFGINFREELNEDQFAAVTAGEGANLVLAGAGSGKTRTLTYRVAYLLSKGYQPWQILLLTFTNKASKEMLERVEELTGVQQKHFWGGTFHHIGQKIIRKHADKVGLSTSYNILDADEADSLLNQSIQNANPGWLKDKSKPKPKLIGNIISYARNTRQTITDVIEQKHYFYNSLSEEIEDFAARYTKVKKEQSVTDYDDLLELWLQLMLDEPEVAAEVQNRFKHVLVDEYQDTNALQSSIVDAVAAASKNVMAVGDDAQCIYTWRGADFENIMSFEERYEQSQLFKIEINYRSTPEILYLANSVLSHRTGYSGFEKELRPIRPSGQIPYYVPVMDTRTQARFIMSKIQALVEEGRQLGDIAVLYRAHYHSMDLQMEFSRVGLPFQITSGIRFFEQAHIKDVTAHIRFVANPSDTLAFQRFVTLLPKVGPKTALRVLEAAQKLAQKKNISVIQVLSDESITKKIPEVARESFVDIAYTLQDMEESLKGVVDSENALFEDRPELKKPYDIVRIAIEGWYETYLQTLYEDWERRSEDLEALKNYASQYEDINELLAQLVLLSAETSNKGTEIATDQLRLTTIHQAKGLEFPIVFVIGLADEQFPLRRAIESGDVEEERRLFYVAVTRAQEELYLTYPMNHLNKGVPNRLDPSRFIRELPADRFEIYRYKPASYQDYYQ